MTRTSLFDYGAERVALATGQPKSQAKTELLHPEKAPDFGARWACICGAELADAKAPCKECGR
jgi:hypothetical protein